MDFIISFFRDTLDGTTYVIVCSVSAVLLCACIGYLADKKSKKESSEQLENNEQPSPIPESSINTPVATEPIENIGMVENLVPPQPENITMPVDQPGQVGEQVAQPVPQEQAQQPLPQESTSPIEGPTENIENTVLGEGTTQVPPMPEQMPTQNIQQPSQVTNEVPQEQPIFPPVDNNSSASPVGITPTPVEATAPAQQTVEGPQEQIQQAPQAIGENINTDASQVAMASANPNLNIPQGVIAGQVGEQVQQPVAPTLPSEVSPSMEASNLEMPQMPVQAETLDNIADATEQIEEEQVIDNPSPTAVAETPTEQPIPQEAVNGQVEPQQVQQPSQAVADQNIETGNNSQTIGQ